MTDTEHNLTAVHDAITDGLQAYAVVGALLAGIAGLLVTVVLVVRDRTEKQEGAT